MSIPGHAWCQHAGANANSCRGDEHHWQGSGITHVVNSSSVTQALLAGLTEYKSEIIHKQKNKQLLGHISELWYGFIQKIIISE